MKLPSEFTIQRSGIAPSQAPVLEHRVFAEPRHLDHESKDAPVPRSSKLNGTGIENGESVEREALSFKLLVNESYDRWSDRHQIGLMDVRNEGREQSARMGEKQAFPTVQPEQVGVPILVGVLESHQVRWARAQKLQRLSRAAENHATHGMCAYARIQAAARRGSRVYSRNNPPSRSVQITSAAVTIGSERAIGVCKPRARWGRAVLYCSNQSTRTRSRCRRLKIRIQSRHLRRVEPICRSMCELALGAAIGVLITSKPSAWKTRSDPSPYLES